MALGSTIRLFEIELSDIDRGVYESLSLKVAQHPSESGAFLVARVLAYALELEEGLVFTTGLSTAEEPALWVRDLTDQLRVWIDIGTPAALRLHKASKAADRVTVYCHKDPGGWLRTLAAAKVHGSEDIALVALPPEVILDIAEKIERRNRWTLSRVEGTIYLEGDGGSWTFSVEPLPWPTDG